MYQNDFNQYGDPAFGGQEQLYAQQPQYAQAPPVQQVHRASVSPQRQVMQHPQAMPVQ